MTPLEAALLVIIVAVLLFLIYYYWKGAKGDISLARPVESRVDEISWFRLLELYGSCRYRRKGFLRASTLFTPPPYVPTQSSPDRS